jgi:hypothetical protein
MLYKDDLRMQPSIDLSAFGIIKNDIWIGLLWRNGIPIKGRLDKTLYEGMQYLSSLNSISILAEYFFSEGFYIGYSCDIPLSKIRGVSYGSHEVIIGFSLGKRSQRVLTPRYF